jgi:hypothetical protein
LRALRVASGACVFSLLSAQSRSTKGAELGDLHLCLNSGRVSGLWSKNEKERCCWDRPTLFWLFFSLAKRGQAQTPQEVRRPRLWLPSPGPFVTIAAPGAPPRRTFNPLLGSPDGWISWV